MNFNDMKISARLILGFAVMGVLIVILGAVAIWKSSVIQTDFKIVTGERIPRVAMLNDIKGHLAHLCHFPGIFRPHPLGNPHGYWGSPQKRFVVP